MDRKPVVSSNIAAIGYESATNTLEVEFTSGAVYEYLGVPAETYEAFLQAESPGRYFATNIKGAYTFNRSK